jgi:hypothetical protein
MNFVSLLPHIGVSITAFTFCSGKCLKVHPATGTPAASSDHPESKHRSPGAPAAGHDSTLMTVELAA